MYKRLQIEAPQTRNAKNPPLNRLSEYKPPRALYLEKKLAKYEIIKQNKNGTGAYNFLYLPKNYYVCQMIAVRKSHNFLLFA